MLKYEQNTHLMSVRIKKNNNNNKQQQQKTDKSKRNFKMAAALKREAYGTFFPP